MEKIGNKLHILAIPLPLQGHNNPMLQFCKRLASRGVTVTLVTFTSANILVQQQFNSINIEFIQGDDDEGIELADVPETGDPFLNRFYAAVRSNLAKLVEKKASSGHPVKVILYDSMMAWILEIVQKLGIKAAAFFTQACAVLAIYNHIHLGTLKFPLDTSDISLPSMPLLKSNDLPSFVYDPCAYPIFLDVVLGQNMNLQKADWLFFNSFNKLESEVVSWLANRYPIKTIGPTIPSMYLDKRLKDDQDYTLNLFKPNKEASTKWLDSKEDNSVVYVSFGSLSDLGENQMQEIAWGLIKSNCNFLWVVRSSEECKIPSNLFSDAKERGLILNWTPQLEVLAHRAVGCFMTHCGWNSTMEALSIGVPMVAMPVWIDQTTNAKFVVDAWKTGVRVKVNSEKGIVTREEVDIRIKEVMHGEKASELKLNALKWKELAKEAMNKGGSSDKHIEEFVFDLERTYLV